MQSATLLNTPKIIKVPKAHKNDGYRAFFQSWIDFAARRRVWPAETDWINGGNSFGWQ